MMKQVTGYEKHCIEMISFDAHDVFGLDLNGSQEDGGGSSGTSSYGGNSPSDM